MRTTIGRFRSKEIPEWGTTLDGDGKRTRFGFRASDDGIAENNGLL